MAEEVLAFWFEGYQKEIYRTKWFPANGSEIQAQTDQLITTKFSALLQAAERRELHENWCSKKESFVALIVLLDQFSRHIYRHDADKRAANDVLALELAEAFVADGHHEHVPTNYFVFALMPFRHTPTHERLADVLKHIDNREALLADHTDILSKFRRTTVQRQAHLRPTSNSVVVNENGEEEFDILERDAFLHPEEEKLMPKHALTPLMHTFLNEMKAGSPSCPAIGISLSGGVDSMVIAYLLVKLAPRYNNYKVVAVHIDYKNRVESTAEATYVEEWCKPLGIECYVRRIDECRRATTKREDYERISRDIRYTTYAEVMARHSIPGMCVGHHRGDVQENVISNMMKGQSLLGLNGMSTSSMVNGVRIWRPLLAIDKDAIFDFAHTFGVPYMKDTTPQWSTRGKLRRQLMPLLQEMYGTGWCTAVGKNTDFATGYLNNLSNLGEEATECASVLENMLLGPVLSTVQHSNLAVWVDLTLLVSQPMFIWKEILRRVCHERMGERMIRDKPMLELQLKVLKSNMKASWITLKKQTKSFVTADKQLILFREPVFQHKVPKGMNIPMGETIWHKWHINLSEAEGPVKDEQRLDMWDVIKNNGLVYYLPHAPEYAIDTEDRDVSLRSIDKCLTDAMPLVVNRGVFSDSTKIVRVELYYAKRPGPMELQERVSYVSATMEKAGNAEYTDAKTPGELEDGALRAGGPPVYTSREVLGLLTQYVCVGLMYVCLPNLVYPVMQGYYQVSGVQYNSTKSLVGLGWSLKVFVGLLSDCVPIYGYRRKSWMMVGWTLCLGFMLVLSCMNLGQPYYTDNDVANISQGGVVAILFGLATISYIVADVPSDALVVEYAQREPLATRGRMQSLVYTTRTVAGVVSTAICGFCMDSPRFAGNFTWDFGANTMYIILCVPCVTMIPVAYFVIHDTKQEAANFKEYAKQVWQLVQKRAMWQIMLFNFFYNLFAGGFASTAANNVMNYWAKVENLNNQIMSIVGSLIFATIVASISKWGTGWNWRIVVVSTTLTTAAIDAIVQYCTFYDVLRNQWFYLGVLLLSNSLRLAEVGNEAVIYGLSTTVSNLSSCVGPVLANLMYSKFDVSQAAIISDTDHVRNQVAETYGIYYSGGAFISIILPSQKLHLHQLKEHGGNYPMIGGAVLTFCLCMLIYSIVCSILSMAPSTSCLPIAGGPGAMDLQERVSYVSATRDKEANENYNDAKTPGELEDGALRAGGPPVYTSREVLGLLSQYVCVGLIYGCLPNILYPVITGYYHLTGAQYNSAKTLLTIGWSLKAFIGMLSDCVPIYGYRRKSWMMIGWTCCLCFLLALSCMDLGEPYYREDGVGDIDPINRTAAQNLTINPDAQTKGGIVAILFGLTTISYLIADVPSDALVVEYAQREPLATRGRMQSLIYTTRTVCTTVSTAIAGFCMNSPRFAGDFTWDFGVNTMYIILCIPAVIMIPVTFFFIHDTKQQAVKFSVYCKNVWEIIQRRAMWQVMLFNFFYNLFGGGFSSTAAPYVQLHWAKVQNLNNQIMTIVSNLIFASIVAAIGKWGTNWNWRIVVVTTTLATAAIDCIVQLCTFYDVLRNQWFYLGVPLAEQLPQGVLFIVTTFMIVELAEVGNEGVIYGLLTTVSNLPGAVGPVLANLIYKNFDVSEDDIVSDSKHVRNQVAETYLIYYSGFIIACFFSFFLPPQKVQLHELQRSGGKYPLVGGLVLCFCFCMLVYSITCSFLSMFKSTKCLVIAGGFSGKELQERVSYISATADKKANDGYDDAKTPGELEDGALRAGGPPVYTSREVLGLLCQYVCVGLIYGCLPNILYPVFAGYYHLTGAQYNSAKTLVNIGWSLKVFVGMLSDCVPIKGYRRKSWMMVGWTCCLCFMLVLSCMDLGEPYYTDHDVSKIAAANRDLEQNATINHDAQTKGGIVAILFGLATISYIIADVPSDALVVEYAQREPLATRGRMQSLVYTTRTVCSTISIAIAGFCMNSPRFTGDFSWDFGVNTMYIILCVPCVIMIPITFFFIHDTKHEAANFTQYCKQVWNIIQRRAMWQVMLFNFFYNLFGGGFSSTAAPYVQLYWAQVENLNSQIMTIISNLIFATIVAAIGKWGTNWNWRIVVTTTTLCTAAIDSIVQYCTFYNVLRNQWFYLGVPLAEQLPQGVLFIVTTFMIVELAEVGNEGIIYGLLTTVSNLPSAVGPVLSNLIYRNFDVTEDDIISDSKHVRNQVAETYLIYYAGFLIACLTSVFLPNQKVQLQHLQRDGGKYPVIGGVVLIFCFCMLVYQQCISRVRALGGAELQERVSYVSATKDKLNAGEDYNDAKTPGELEDGALRAGGAPVYKSPEVIALLAQYACVGLVYGCIPNLLYPIIQGYYAMSGAQYNSAKTLVGIGWSLKAFIGMASDCAPIFGYRRKSWMVVGWTCCMVFLLVLACMDMGDPYYRDSSISSTPVENLTEAELLTINHDAPKKGGIVAILFGLATISYLFADVPADALVVEYAQREPIAIRGRMQSLIYVTRTIFSTVMQAVCGFCMNSARFGGDFSWDFGVHTVYIILCVPCLIMVPITFFFVHDTKVQRPHFGAYIKNLWGLIQRRATWQVMLFNFFFNLLSSGFSSTAAPYVMSKWAGVQNLNYQLMGILGNFIFAGITAAIGRWGTNWDWRRVIISTTICTTVIDAVVQYCTIYDVLRNQWFYLGVPLAENVPQGVLFIVTTFVIVELAEVGNEGIMYGMLTTVSNLPSAAGPVIANLIYSNFEVSKEKIVADSMHTRHQVAYTYAIYYGCMLAACALVLLYPSQKAQLHELQTNGGNYPVVGGCVIGFVICMLIYSITCSVLSMFESTSCLKIAGGDGC
ncbi:tRNA(Ile)-lysidine synthase [Thraustotheca clavata]|uniref:tRNA(Ile)-lysidine synthetase n=1 Tax=Thraustotheca clavata TaxID=74557 RepID=A0A1W0A8F0_9STRA|nr:tRNA(Ile)-lysidine synthase [Thraustotheca clavata]